MTAIDIALEPDATMAATGRGRQRPPAQKPIRRALLWTQHTMRGPRRCSGSSSAPPSSKRIYSAADAVSRRGRSGKPEAQGDHGSRQGRSGKPEAQGDQVLLHSLSPTRHRQHRGRVDRRFAPAAIRTAGRCCAFHREDRDTCRVRQHRRWARHPTRTYRLRSQFHHGCSKQKVQSARRNWCRFRDLCSTRCSRNRSRRSRFSLVGAAVYQLGSFGAARKELQALSLTP